MGGSLQAEVRLYVPNNAIYEYVKYMWRGTCSCGRVNNSVNRHSADRANRPRPTFGPPFSRPKC